VIRESRFKTRQMGMLLVTALLLAACGSAAETTSSASAPASAPASTAEESASQVPTGPAAALIEPIVCLSGRETEEGTYRSPYTWGEFGIAFDVPDGWQSCREDRPGGGVVGLIRGEPTAFGHGSEWLAFFAVPEGVDIDALVEELRMTPLLEVGASEDAVVGGEPGVAFEGTAEFNPDQPATSERAAGVIGFPGIDRIFPGPWRSETPEAQFRFTVVGHGTQGVVVYQEGPAATFDALLTDSQPIIDSVRFLD
jgi:hypothetical protein